jgi:hypothetical protein
MGQRKLRDLAFVSAFVVVAAIQPTGHADDATTGTETEAEVETAKGAAVNKAGALQETTKKQAGAAKAQLEDGVERTRQDMDTKVNDTTARLKNVKDGASGAANQKVREARDQTLEKAKSLQGAANQRIGAAKGQLNEKAEGTRRAVEGAIKDPSAQLQQHTNAVKGAVNQKLNEAKGRVTSQVDSVKRKLAGIFGKKKKMKHKNKKRTPTH